MADGAWEISKAADEVFDDTLDNLRTRLMCWSHVYRNIRPKLASIRKTNKLLGESILSDIEALQWMCQTAAEFNRLTELLVQHYSTNPALSANELTLVSSFFDYFLQQWGPGSHVQNWYAGDCSKRQRIQFLHIRNCAGSHSFAVDNNQGLEGTHAQYKKDHTFRSEVALFEFVCITENLVRVEF